MTFDIAAFTQTQFSEAPADKYIGIPAKEWVFQIGTDAEKTLSMKTGTIEKGENAGSAWAMLSIKCSVVDPAGELKASHGANPSHTHTLMLDLKPGSTPENPVLDFGVNKNLRLGKLLIATGVKDPANPSKPWGITSLLGKSFKGRVEETPDRRDPTDKRSEIVSVAPVAA